MHDSHYDKTNDAPKFTSYGKTTWTLALNSSPSGQNGRQFADVIFSCIFINEKFCILIIISLKLVPKGPIIGLHNGLVPNRQQAIIWTNVDPIHWRIYMALGGDELIGIIVIFCIGTHLVSSKQYWIHCPYFDSTLNPINQLCMASMSIMLNKHNYCYQTTSGVNTGQNRRENIIDLNIFMPLNSLAPGRLKWNFRYHFQANSSNWRLRYLLWNCPQMTVTALHWWSLNIGSGNGLVPSGNKPLSEPMLTQISAAIWRH